MAPVMAAAVGLAALSLGMAALAVGGLAVAVALTVREVRRARGGASVRPGLAVAAGALYLAWYLQAGCLKRQFNTALRRGYPGFDHLKL